LKKRLGNDTVGCEGISSTDGYGADLIPNLLPAGTTPAAIAAGTAKFKKVHSKCPNAKIVFSGYRFVDA
jgi:Cutinase